MSFFLLILTTAVLLIRPADYFLSLQSAQLYLIAIGATLAISFPVVLNQLTPASLQRQPMTACVLSLVPMAAFTALANGHFDDLTGIVVEILKTVIFYLLVVGLVTTPRRLRTYLLCLLFILAFTVGMSVLQYLGYIDNIAFYRMVRDRNGQMISTYSGWWMNRMTGPGAYDDPNDICLLINMLLLLSLFALTTTRPRILAVVWLAPCALAIQALQLTESRGGLLAALGGIGVVLTGRFGLRKGLLLAALALPVVLAQFGGRQIDLGTAGGTAQERIQLWHDAVTAFIHSPVFGVGPERTRETIGRPPHNSFLQAYVDLGFLGGVLYLAIFLQALRRMYNLRPQPGRPSESPDLEVMRPYVLGILFTYAIGMSSTNHTYAVATFGVMGTAAAYISISGARNPATADVVNGKFVGRSLVVGLAYIIVMFAYVTTRVRWGG